MRSALPVLYSFRRCPYAMRARLALATSGQACALREVVLRNKPAALLAASAKGTVPVLVLPDGTLLEQSLDIMLWALRRHDPGQYLVPDMGSAADMLALIAECDGPFKQALDHCKYPERYPDTQRAAQPWPHLQAWLARWLASPLLGQVMHKYPPWQEGTPGVLFAAPPGATHQP